MLSIPHYINGQFAPSGDASLPVVNPQTQSAYAHVARGSSQNVDEAVRAAQRAFPQWSSLSNSERAEWLDKLADGLQQRLEQFAQAESLNTGKPVALTRDIEIPRAVSNLRFFAAAATQFSRFELHLAHAARRRRLYLAVESAAVFVHLEDRARACGRQLRNRKAL
jgi:aminomuconate-semialdehyde/2-hydroxymuconate-6-semialdehyde dehydrogenase